MRRMSPAASAKINQQFGAEPIIVVAINVAGNFIYFGDREHEKFRARITEVAGLDSVINISMNMSQAAVTIQFIDVDGELKQLFDNHDLHKKPCRIYQYFEGTDFDTDKIMVFDGQLASPITYDEAQMTLTVTGLSKLEDIEVGFSPDNSLWNDIVPNEIEPQAWPMPFGTPINYPLVQITQEPYGTLVHGFGIPSLTHKHLQAARASQLANNEISLVTVSHAVYVSVFKLEQLAAYIYELQTQIADRQVHLNRVQIRLANTMTAIADRDAPTPREGSPQELADAATKELWEQIDATREAARALGFKGNWRPSAVRENLLRNAQYELQDATTRYNATTQSLQQDASRAAQQFNYLAARRREWEQEQERRKAISAQIAQQAAEERQRERQEAAHALKLGLGDVITIWNGPRFPYDRPLWLKIGDALVRGRFQHTSYAHEGVSNFRVSEVVHPQTCEFTGKHCTELHSERFRQFPTTEYGKYSSIADLKMRQWGASNGLPADILDPQKVDPSARYDATVAWLRKMAPDKVSLFQSALLRYQLPSIEGQTADFHWVASGSRVRIAYGNPMEFILSIVPCKLLRLAAYRTYNGQRQLTTVPTEWYSLEERDYGDGLHATVVVLKRPLDTIANANFEAQLYATVESEIGPNVVDVLRYLVEKYLPNVSCDDETFTKAKSETAIWPVNFALLERFNILELLSSICHQACLGIWFSEGTVRLRYLPNVPDQVTDITASNIDTNSLRISYTATEDVTTKLIATYFPSYDLDGPIRLAARYNVSKYGVTTQNIDFFIYNDREAVVHSTTFWLIRTANTWKYLEFSTAMDTLVFETMDAVTVDLSNNFCARGPVTGIIEQVEYDSQNYTLNYRVWLPVRAGEMETYKFAYYNVGDIDDEFPEPQDWATGNGLGPPLIRHWRRTTGPQYTVIIGPRPSQIPELKALQAPVMLQPKKPRRQYVAEPSTPTSGYPVSPPVDGGYGDPQFPPQIISNPDDPVAETLETDTLQFLPGADTPAAPRVPAEVLGPMLNLQRTLVLDEQTGEMAVLSSFFKGVQDNLLRISSRLPVIDENDVAGIFEMKHVPGTEDFAAKLAYLAEDDSPDVPAEES